MMVEFYLNFNGDYDLVDYAELYDECVEYYYDEVDEKYIRGDKL